MIRIVFVFVLCLGSFIQVLVGEITFVLLEVTPPLCLEIVLRVKPSSFKSDTTYLKILKPPYAHTNEAQNGLNTYLIRVFHASIKHAATSYYYYLLQNQSIGSLWKYHNDCS
jgi:hypothetical protein